VTTGTSDSGTVFAPITYSSATTDVCSVTPAGSVHLIKAGTCTLTATEAAIGQFDAASATRSFLALLAPQTITFPTLNDRNFDPLAFNAQATATSGLTVTVTSSTTSVCTASLDGLVTLFSPGVCTLIASQPGTADYYAAAASVSRTFTVSKAPQVINLAATADQVLGTGPITINANSSSGLPVSLSTSGSACSINGTALTLLAAGQCVVLANQVGNSNYLAAPQVQNSFSIASAASGGESADIPTLPEWAVIVLGCLLLAQTFKQSQTKRRQG
jgi:hypothetical protein